MKPAVRVSDLSLRFGNVVALDSVNCTVSAGSTFAVIGPNGAGKSSFFNILTAMYSPTAGDVEVLGVDINRCRPQDLAGKGVVRSFQNLGLFAEMSVLDNVLIGAHHRIRSGMLADIAGLRRARSTENRERAAAMEILRQLAVHDIASRPVGGLPYGVQKRVEIARCLAAHPKILLLDEPVAGMSTDERTEIVDVIEQLKSDPELTILIVEHDVGMVMRIADTVMVLDFGNVIALGAPAQVRSDPAVIRAYLGASVETHHD